MMPRYTRTPGPLPHFQTPCGDAATLYVDPPETDGHPVDLRPEGRDAEADKIRSINRESLKIIQGLGIWQRDPADGELNGVLFGIENTRHEPHRGLDTERRHRRRMARDCLGYIALSRRRGGALRNAAQAAGWPGTFRGPRGSASNISAALARRF